MSIQPQNINNLNLISSSFENSNSLPVFSPSSEKTSGLVSHIGAYLKGAATSFKGTVTAHPYLTTTIVLVSIIASIVGIVGIVGIVYNKLASISLSSSLTANELVNISKEKTKTKTEISKRLENLEKEIKTVKKHLENIGRKKRPLALINRKSTTTKIKNLETRKQILTAELNKI